MIRSSKSLLAAIALAIAVHPVPAQIEGVVEAPSSRIRVVSEPSDEAGAILKVTAPTMGAEVYLDRSYAGSTPFSASALAPGSYLIEVKARGYRGLSLSIALSDRTKYSIHFALERLIGRLDLELSPADARARIGEVDIRPGLTDLPIGTYELRVARFGYAEKTEKLSVSEGSTTLLRVTLDEAAFAIADLRATRPVFNPRNAGAPGRTEIAFAATNYGSARASILGPDGGLAAVLVFPSISTWEQGSAWDGRGKDGSYLPDGEYRVRLEAAPRPGVPVQPPGPGIGPDGSVIAETRLSLDSSVIVRSFGSVGALPGLLFFPDPKAQPRGTSTTEASWFSPLDAVEDSAIGLSTALALGRGSALAVSAAAELAGSGESGALDAAASILVGLGADPASPLGAALFLRASRNDAPHPAMPDARDGIEASIPFSYGFGPFRFGLAAGFLLDLSSSSPAAAAIARAGMWVEGPAFRAGLSGELSFGETGAGFGAAWPARAGAEARFMLSPSPLVASAYIAAELDPGKDPRLSAGAGLGLLY